MVDMAAFLASQSDWLNGSGPSSHLVVSTRVRLARNLAAYPFAGKTSSDDEGMILRQITDASQATASLKGATVLLMGELSEPERRLLYERHLVSRELAGLGTDRPIRGSAATIVGSGVVMMVNEEDHLRIQGLSSGLAIGPAYGLVRQVDLELGQRLAFAFHSQFGYLTSCPTNVGTGLRASVLAHLPGLVLTKEISRVLQGLAQVGLTFRGFYGEGSEVVGNLFQLSNQTTLGRSEADLIDHLARVVAQVLEHEETARRILIRDAALELEDKVWRAYGLLRHARILGFEETMNLLSGVRLGVGLGLVSNVGIEVLNRLIIETQPAHLGRIYRDSEGRASLDELRAKHVGMLLNG